MSPLLKRCTSLIPNSKWQGDTLLHYLCALLFSLLEEGYYFIWSPTGEGRVLFFVGLKKSAHIATTVLNQLWMPRTAMAGPHKGYV